jgi:hydroxymethylbilane synthase
VADIPSPATRTGTITVGTRGSVLARTQADFVAAQLRTVWPNLDVQAQVIKTEGDRKLDIATTRLGKGAFVKEIERALLAGEIDVAVHSCKDLPTEPVPGLTVAAFPRRADARDTLVSSAGHRLAELPAGAVVGTGSNRRRAQLLINRPDLKVADIRGNVETRLRKMEEGQYDAVLLAAAGLDRLGWLDRATEILVPDVMLPAPAQGALAVQARADDASLLAFLEPLDDDATRAAVTAERAFLAGLGGGCRVPIGAYATVSGHTLILDGIVAAADGTAHMRRRITGDIPEHIPGLSGPGEPAASRDLGARLAQQMLALGADELLAENADGDRAGWA